MSNQKVVFHVEGIHCPKCVNALEQHVSQNQGVLSVKAELNSPYSNAEVVFNPSLISISELSFVIAQTPNKQFKVVEVINNSE